MGEDKEIKVSKIKKIEKINPVEQVSPIEKTSKVTRVRQPTQSLTAEERARLLKLIEEEAKELVKSGVIPERDEEIITKAVEYALESTLITPEEENS